MLRFILVIAISLFVWTEFAWPRTEFAWPRTEFAWPQSKLPPCPSGKNVHRDNCFGTLIATNNGKYVGEFKNGKADGEGEYSWPDGRKYIGEFKNNRMNGQGNITWPDGHKYVGQFRDDVRVGQGTYTWPDGEKYVGEFKANHFDGPGTRYAADGLIKKQGVWQNSKFIDPNKQSEAAATKTIVKDVELAATVRSDLPPCPKGKGAYWDNCFGTYGTHGDKYTGEWRQNKKNGSGESINRFGQKYIGKFKDDEMSGDGSETYPNGDKYIGEFAHNTQYGQGKYIFHDGKIYEGEWVHNQQNGFGVLRWKDGKKYAGEFKSNTATAKGQLEYPNGESYVGEFNHSDQRHGKGIQYSDDGSVKQFGYWVNDKFLKPLPIGQAKEFDKREVEETVKNPSKQTDEKIAAIYPPISTIRAALIIANSNYVSAPPLQNPINDANLLANSLRSAGFQSVTIKSDQTRENLISSIQQFSKTADGYDWAVIYYSGHGIAYNGVNYMIPIDATLKADKDIQLEAVDVNAMVSALDGVKKLRVVVLDMCRSNPFVGGMRRSVASRSIGRGLLPIEPEAGVLTVFAAKDGQEALDGEGKNSPFAEALAKRILTPNLEIRRLFDLVRDDVLETTDKKQMPFSYGSVSGKEDFYFVRK